MTPRVLFIGGTGIISSACSPLAIQQGMPLFLLNRGKSLRQTPSQATLIVGDINADPSSLVEIVEQHQIDVVVNWVAYDPDQVQRDIDLLEGRVGQYVFISSASAYQKPVPSLPITEETPLNNPFWEYSRNKKACEELLLAAHAKSGFPATIVRPSHTYDKTLIPMHGGWTLVERMLQGKPVVIHGDGTSLWVLTHHADFARGFVPLLGNPKAIGEIFHITSDELLPWNRIFELVAKAAGAELKAVHVTSEVIAQYDDDWGASILGDKSHSVIFDNSKIKALVPDFSADIPFEQGAQEIVDWYLGNPSARTIDPEFVALQDRIIADQQRSRSN